jgi:hypothetical protein
MRRNGLRRSKRFGWRLTKTGCTKPPRKLRNVQRGRRLKLMPLQFLLNFEKDYLAEEGTLVPA